MRPQWFPLDALPFDKMWCACRRHFVFAALRCDDSAPPPPPPRADDPLWFPLLLAGKTFTARVLFRDHSTILEHHIAETDAVPEE